MVVDGERHPMTRVHADGHLRGDRARHGARLPARRRRRRSCDDPYRHLPTLGELDLHLIGEGRHEKLWKVLGAQPTDGGVALRRLGAQRPRACG